MGTAPDAVADVTARVRRRYECRRGLWRASSLPRLAACGRVCVGLGADVGVHRVEGEDGPRGAVTGLASCGSVWCCPVCAAHIRQARAEDVQAGAERHQDGGGGLGMVTLTIRHGAAEGLAGTLNGVLDAWRRTIMGAPWKRLRARFGVVGYIRSIEITWGQANGWHPHVHVLLATKAPLTGAERVELEHALWLRWRTMVLRAGLGEPDREHGVRLDVGGSALAGYIVKVQERGLALEMTRGDLKVSRGERWQPFDIALLAGDGVKDAVTLWHEYERATKGRRAIHWSRGLRDLWGLDDEVEDQELVEEHETSPETQLVSVTATDWRAVVEMGADYTIREAAAHPDGREAALDAVLTVLGDALYFRPKQRPSIARGPLYADVALASVQRQTR